MFLVILWEIFKYSFYYWIQGLECQEQEPVNLPGLDRHFDGDKKLGLFRCQNLPTSVTLLSGKQTEALECLALDFLVLDRVIFLSIFIIRGFFFSKSIKLNFFKVYSLFISEKNHDLKVFGNKKLGNWTTIGKHYYGCKTLGFVDSPLYS